MKPFNYSMPLYRPPSEGNNLILQVTEGCCHNLCTFCSMYKNKVFRVKSLDEIYKEIDFFSVQFPQVERVFLADGDAYHVDFSMLKNICQKLNKSFLRLTRISAYATPANILKKSDSEIQELVQHKLNLVYVGVETGSDLLLKKIRKGVSHKLILKALNKAYENELKTSSTIILGLGGEEHSEVHARETAKLFSSAPTTFLSSLQLFLDAESSPEFYSCFGNQFKHLDDVSALKESYALIKDLCPPDKIIFRSNHASNALALSGNLPDDREKLLNAIELAVKNPHILRSPNLRGL